MNKIDSRKIFEEKSRLRKTKKTNDGPMKKFYSTFIDFEMTNGGPMQIPYLDFVG